MCTPAGIECYESVKEIIGKCLIPCQGIFADVVKDTDFKQMEEIDEFKTVLEEYNNYKTGYARNSKYTEEVGGNSFNHKMQNISDAF